MPKYTDLCGWTPPTTSQFLAVCQSLPMPIFGDVYGTVKGSGAGKVVILSDYVKKLTGNYIGQVQAIGDCWIGSTLITMFDGSKKEIQNIIKGDYVLSAKNNKRKVVNTICKKNNTNLYEIEIEGHYTKLVCTGDHNILCCERKKRGNRENVFYVPASELDRKTHYIICPYGYNSILNDYFNFDGKLIEIDTDVAYLIGLYLAEGGCKCVTLSDGSLSWQAVQFSLCIDEELIAEEIIDILKRKFDIVGKKVYNQSYKNVLKVEVYNKKFATFIKSIIPGNIYEKYVPIEIIKSTKASKLACLRGWVVGDGQTKVIQNKAIGVSSSKNLIRTMAELSTSCGLVTSFIQRKRAVHQRVAAQELQFFGSYIKPFGEPVKRVRNLRNKNSIGILRRVKSVNKLSMCADVYCFEVEEDHSFIADGIASKNCVSFGAAHAVDHTYCTEIALKGEMEEWVALTSTEDIYGGSRILIGNGKLGYGDGSIGAWAAKYVNQYGTLIRQKYEKDDLTTYSGNRAKQWGNPGAGTPRYLLDFAKEHRIRTVSLIQTYEEARDAIANGYAVTIASNQGFSSTRDKDGFLKPYGSWPHQMCLIGVDDAYSRKGVLCLNSWPYSWVNGPTRHNMPPGSFWIDANVLEERILRGRDSWAFSDREGFPVKELNWRIV